MAAPPRRIETKLIGWNRNPAEIGCSSDGAPSPQSGEGRRLPRRRPWLSCWPEERPPKGSSSVGGDVAQLVERLVRNEEVEGSTPFVSTNNPESLEGSSSSRAPRSPPHRVPDACRMAPAVWALGESCDLESKPAGATSRCLLTNLFVYSRCVCAEETCRS